MKINVDQTLIAYNGTQMSKSPQDSTPAMLRDVLANACLQSQESGGEAKYRTYQLLMRIDRGGEVEFTAEEVAKLKSLVGQAYGVAVVGPVWDALEGNVQPDPMIVDRARVAGKH